MHTCVNSNMQSTKFLLSLLTGYKKSVYNRANYIFGKTVEKLRRKAIGPVKWQPVAKLLDTQLSGHFVSGSFVHFGGKEKFQC